MLCISDNLHEENPFKWACDYLSDTFAARVCSIDSIPTDFRSDLVLSNCPSVLGLTPNALLYLTNSEDWSVADRRLVMFRSKQIEIFSASMKIARGIFDRYKIKTKIQYPYVAPNGNASPQCIVYTGHFDELKSIFPSEEFRPYSDISDLAFAKLYIHNSEDPARVLLAGSFGVPSLCLNVGSISEFISGGDTLLPAETNIKQWEQTIRISMRDRDRNAIVVKQFSQKYNNLDAIADKVKKGMTPKEIIPSPKPKENPFLQKRISEKSKQVIAKRVTPDFVIPEFESTPRTVFAGFQKCPYAVPTSVSILPTESWMSMDNSVKISIIVPLFNSAYAIDQQIRNWDMSDTNISREIIYIDDGCPQKSAEVVIRSWEYIRAHKGISKIAYPKGFNYRIGKIIKLSHNSGFATACNIGAKHSKGEYLLFLNADCIPTPNWINPMLELMEKDESIGIVGNLQLKQDGTIDSAGSEWMWDSRSFEHIGRNIFNGQRLKKTMNMSNCPESILEVAEREMVTGCCFMIRKKLFEEVEGFDVNYRIGYWEDSDLNMKVRSSGYKVYYQPNSIVYHQTGHSGASGHPYVMDNARYFYNKWVNNGKIDSFVKAGPGKRT
jgi:GT2 family glycosyltransferase